MKTKRLDKKLTAKEIVITLLIAAALNLIGSGDFIPGDEIVLLLIDFIGLPTWFIYRLWRRRQQ